MELTGVAANCAVEGDNPRTVAVAGDATAPVAFAVTCSTILGSLQVTTSTSGSSPDPDGYSLSVDGGAPLPVGPNATVPVEGLLVGPHTIVLSGAASNCHVTGENPRSVTVVAGSAPVGFEINCLGADALVAFFSNAAEPGRHLRRQSQRDRPEEPHSSRGLRVQPRLVTRRPQAALCEE